MSGQSRRLGPRVAERLSRPVFRRSERLPSRCAWCSGMLILSAADSDGHDGGDTLSCLMCGRVAGLVESDVAVAYGQGAPARRGRPRKEVETTH